MVWDEQTSEPAMIGGKALIGLKHQRAETVCDFMERIETGKLTRRPTRLARSRLPLQRGQNKSCSKSYVKVERSVNRVCMCLSICGS
jgi:hypothetical protein